MKWLWHCLQPTGKKKYLKKNKGGALLHECTSHDPYTELQDLLCWCHCPENWLVSRLCCNKCLFVILNIKQSRFTPIVLHEYVCEFPIYLQLACEGKPDYSDETTDTSDNTQTSHKKRSQPGIRYRTQDSLCYEAAVLTPELLWRPYSDVKGSAHASAL